MMNSFLKQAILFLCLTTLFYITILWAYGKFQKEHHYHKPDGFFMKVIGQEQKAENTTINRFIFFMENGE